MCLCACNEWVCPHARTFAPCGAYAPCLGGSALCNWDEYSCFCGSRMTPCHAGRKCSRCAAENIPHMWKRRLKSPGAPLWATAVRYLLGRRGIFSASDDVCHYLTLSTDSPVLFDPCPSSTLHPLLPLCCGFIKHLLIVFWQAGRENRRETPLRNARSHCFFFFFFFFDSDALILEDWNTLFCKIGFCHITENFIFYIYFILDFVLFVVCLE